MIKSILFTYKPYTKQEKAKAILFDGVSADSFVLANVFDGVEYYKKIK